MTTWPFSVLVWNVESIKSFSYSSLLICLMKMVKKCCIKTCKSESYAGCGISFHSFPSKEELKQEWLDVIPKSQTITKNSVVCCLHFKPADFYISKSRRVLNANAVPSIFPVCKGKQCVGHCSKEECIAACEGDGCGVQCEGNICHAVADGAKVTSKCKGDYCVAYGKGLATKSTCDGNHCQTWCAGDNCIAECKGVHCEAMCAGYHCKAQCQGRNCTKSHYAGYPPKPGKPWVVESDSNSKEKSISDEFDVKKPHGTKPNKYEYSANVDNDGYYGNKDHVKHTINSIDSTFVPNDNKDYNSGNVPIESVPNGMSDPERNVTIGYTIDITVGKELTDYLKEKIHQMDDLTLLRYLPSLL